MSSPPQLAAHVHVAWLGNQAIVLDVLRNRYVALQGEVADALATIVQRRDHALATPAGIESLFRRGWLTERQDAQPRVESRDYDPPEQDIGESESFKMAPKVLGSVGSSLAWQIRTQMALRAFTLSSVLEKCRSKRDSISRAPHPETLTRIVRGFEWSNRLVSSHDRCLMKSIALHRALSFGKVRSFLVIGVRAPPFAAHAWVQVGSTVLNDKLGHVRQYTPILVV